MAAFFGANEIWKSYDGDGREPVILVGVRDRKMSSGILWRNSLNLPRHVR